ncbi:MAG TPA: condensation domain-containing protein, partial [Gemmatimonadales bacterium]|nr:condensation domain-containing protein [Gemmatimonadales bacterium]
PLAWGGAVLLVQDFKELANLPPDAEPTLINSVPSAMELLQLERLPASIRVVNLAGEPLSPSLVRRVYEKTRAEKVFDLYGPTECTTYSTFALREAHSPAIIGRPIANTRAYVLDARRRPVAIGMPGELYLGGAGLARGYWQRPGLTRQKFIPDPFSQVPEARLYRTGDRVRYRSDGNLEFLGRIDDQVKVRGYRIELGEVEAVLAEHPAVRETVVVVREGVAGDKRLVAYLVAAREPVLSVSELRSYLKGKLPDYMVPSAFVTLDALPLTPNGKVDRRALPAPEQARPELEGAFVRPRTAVEEVLAGIWSKVLGVEQVGVHDNFFDLGGHSLRATQVMSRICDAFRVELPLRTFFETPTVAGLAEAVEVARRAGVGLQAPPLLPVSRPAELPLSFAQQRLWFLDQLEPGSSLYNIPCPIRVSGALNVEALHQALEAIVARHESLRTTFPSVDGRPMQVIAERQPVALPVTDLSEHPEGERASGAQRLVTEEARRPFDLARGPLVRASLVRLSDDDHILLLTMHHIVIDGWSLGIFNKELAALYKAFSFKCPSTLPELPIQYADFAQWQRQWLQGETLEEQLSYWRERLSDAPPVLELPTDRPRPAVQSFRGAHQSVLLPKELSEGLKALSQREGATLFMTLLAAFQTLLHRYTGQEDVVVGSPIANRNRAEVEGLIGFFVNTLVMRTDLSGDPTFRELLGRVREVALGAYAHQDLPFEKLVEELQPERDLSRTPLFQAMFVLQNTPGMALELPGLTVQPLRFDLGISKFDLTLYAVEEADELRTVLEYNTDLFDAATITRMLGHLRTLLEGAVACPERRLSELPIFTEAEHRQLLVEWNDTAADYPRQSCVHQLFEAQVERTPERVARAPDRHVRASRSER